MSGGSADQTIPAGVMRDLITAGQAEPLLLDHFPVPVLLGDSWWHVPVAAAATGAGESRSEVGDGGSAEQPGAAAPEEAVFVEASAELAEHLEDHAARVRAAAAAVRGHGHPRR